MKWILIYGAITYLSIAILVFFFADSIIFQPPHPSYGDSSNIIKLETEDGATIALWHSKKLYSMAKSPKYHLWIAGADHNAFYLDNPEYWRAIDQLINAIEKN